MLNYFFPKEFYMTKYNAFYAQSGGVTAVINASAAGVIEAFRASQQLGQLYAGLNGIAGALNENLVDTQILSTSELKLLKQTPGGIFGSCRIKLKSIQDNKTQFERILSVFKAHNIKYFFYNGGGDSQDTAAKMANYCENFGYDLVCIGIPKTIDNDLPLTDNSPGFGSVAKYIATSILEASLDLKSMCDSSTKVFILEVMGRHAGWIAASSGLSQDVMPNLPLLILLPELALDEQKLCQAVLKKIQKYGYCSIVVSEGLKNQTGQFLSQSHYKDAFGHAQLGGVAPIIAHLIKRKLQLKCHWSVADYLQRSAGHLSAQVDLTQAYALGQAAVNFALTGHRSVMPIIKRLKDEPYEWSIGQVALGKVANVEVKMPEHFISEDGLHITEACKIYLRPLIQGEVALQFKKGLPQYLIKQFQSIEKKLPDYVPD